MALRQSVQALLTSLLVLIGLSLARPTLAGPSTVPLGRDEYTRMTGTPTPVTVRFYACRPERAFRLRVENGPDGRPRVSSGAITLNGLKVVRERDFSQQVALLERPVALQTDNTLVVRLAGKPGGTVAVSIVSDAGCLEVALDTPPPGASVPAGPLLVRGTVRGAPEVGVTISGVPAAVEGEEFVALVPVSPEVTELRAVAAAADGATAEARQALTVTPAPESVLRLRPIPPGGAAPLAVGFSLSSLTGITEIALDLEGNGSVDFQESSLDGETFSYLQAGIYTPTVYATDPDGHVDTATAVLHVYDVASLDARLQAAWRGLKDALRGGDVAHAVTLIHHDTRAQYEDLFQRLGPDVLADIDQYLTTIELVEVGFGGAQYEMLRQRDGQTLSFAVWFQLDRDGLWRLRRF